MPCGRSFQPLFSRQTYYNNIILLVLIKQSPVFLSPRSKTPRLTAIIICLMSCHKKYAGFVISTFLACPWQPCMLRCSSADLCPISWHSLTLLHSTQLVCPTTLLQPLWILACIKRKGWSPVIDDWKKCISRLQVVYLFDLIWPLYLQMLDT